MGALLSFVAAPLAGLSGLALKVGKQGQSVEPFESLQPTTRT